MKLGKPEKNGPGWRWKKMLKGKQWKSSTFEKVTPEAKEIAWQQFLAWQRGDPDWRQISR